MKLLCGCEELRFTWVVGKDYGKKLPSDLQSKIQRQAAIAINFMLAERIGGYQYLTHTAGESSLGYLLKKAISGNLIQCFSTLLQTGFFHEASLAVMTERLPEIKRQWETLSRDRNASEGRPAFYFVPIGNARRIVVSIIPQNAKPATCSKSSKVTGS